MARLILASGSPIRAQMLAAAGVEVEVVRPRVDEAAIRESLLAEGAGPRDVADTLAEYKARNVAERAPDALVIGGDQVLDCEGVLHAKAESLAAAADTLRALRGRPHRLYSAAVAWEGGEPVWRHVGVARLTMRPFSEAFLKGYLARNAEAALTSVGAYRIEEEGLRLFSRIEGDHFTILGLPLMELLGWLTLTGRIEG